MNDDLGFPVKKAFLYTLIGSVGLSAMLGIGAILSGRFEWFEIRILLTTVTVSGASICGLASGAYWATGRGQALPLAGMVLSVVAAAMVIGGMWIEIGSEAYWKLAASLSVFAIACGHLSLLSMARLADGFQWSLAAAYAAIFGVAMLIVLAILTGFDGVEMFPLLGVAAIFDAAITILIPIFHRLSAGEVTAPGNVSIGPSMSDIDEEIRTLRERLLVLEQIRLGWHDGCGSILPPN